MNNTVGSGNESRPTSSSSHESGEGTGGGREGESALPPPAPPYSTSTSDSGEGVSQAQPGVKRRIDRVDCRQNARGNESKRAPDQAGIGAGRDVRDQRGQRTIPKGV